MGKLGGGGLFNLNGEKPGWLFNLNGEMGGAISFEWGNGGGGGYLI